MAVAAAVDAMKWNEVVGCIAGDDTIMCAIRSVEDTAAVMEKIRKIITKEIAFSLPDRLVTENKEKMEC